MCGGTAIWPALSLRGQGLSPRVRGNPAARTPPAARSRSIPACAGEPHGSASRRCSGAVYPRVCGGTRSISDVSTREGGLSPRVRGNRQRGHERPRYMRSIPACAGEPVAPVYPATRYRVYPRVCGGTWSKYSSGTTWRGLSPRVRGNRVTTTEGPGREGSIPACAGEPDCGRATSMAFRVYPRVCGGTRWSLFCPPLSWGLSPRVRGNPLISISLFGGRRSIPACAGEPALPCLGRCLYWVYPRVCGGTPRWTISASRCEGLSPRVRGNRRGPLVAVVGLRSIPACAGEPSASPAARGSRGVYPRVCGGTSSP